MSRTLLVGMMMLAAAGCRGRTDDQAQSAPSTEAASSSAVPNAAPAAAEAEPQPTPVVETATGDQPFEVAGVATAMRNTRLSLKAGGILKSIRVREGVLVGTGQALCSLDTTDLAIRVEGAEVAHKLALAGVTNAQQDRKRAEELYKGGASTDQGIEKAELALTVATLQAQAAAVALKSAQQALYDATLRAPFPGVITKVLAEEGTMVSTMPPTVVFQLVDTSVIEVRAPIPERMLAAIKVGQPVVVTLPTIKVERQAKVDRIPEVVDTATRSVEAVIRLDNRDRAIPANVYARVRFTGVRASDSAEADTAVAGATP